MIYCQQKSIRGKIGFVFDLGSMSPLHAEGYFGWRLFLRGLNSEMCKNYASEARIAANSQALQRVERHKSLIMRQIRDSTIMRKMAASMRLTMASARDVPPNWLDISGLRLR